MGIVNKIKKMLALPPAKEEKKAKIGLKPDAILPSENYAICEENGNYYSIYYDSQRLTNYVFKKIEQAESICWQHHAQINSE